jgi:hypothetical protein
VSYEERDRFEPEEPGFSKQDLLRTAVECGAVLGDRDIPYDGAHRHARELIEEGMLLELPPPFGGEGVRWIPTVCGRILGTRDE